MPTRPLQFNFRLDPEFMPTVDDWRTNFRPILSQSESIRRLTRRGAIMDGCLSEVLERSVSHLLEGGVLTKMSSREVYDRLATVVIQSLDEAAKEHHQARSAEDARPPEAPVPENDSDRKRNQSQS